MVGMKDISIVIVNYKMRKHIEKCLASLYKDFADSNLVISVVVVDNNSDDGTEDFLKKNYPEISYLQQDSNVGFGKSQNRGIKFVKAKYYFPLNPDTEFPSGTSVIDRLYQYMEDHPKIGMIGPKILYPDGSLQYSSYRFPTFLQPVYSRTKFGNKGRGKKVKDHFLMKDFDHNSTIPVDWIMGSAMFVRSDAIDDVGMFDDRYWMYAEDSDWCRRMWESGWPVYYVHNITIKHVHGRGSASVPGIFKALLKNKLARIHIKSWLQYMWKWRGNCKYYGKLS